MKNILLFTPYYIPYISGITIYNELLAQFLDKKNNITVLTFTKGSKDPSVVHIPHLIKISKGFISPQSLVYFWRYVRKSNIIIVSLPNVEGLCLVLLAALLGKPIVAMYYCNVTLGKDFVSRFIVAILNISVRIQLMLATKIITISGYQDFLIPHSDKFSECLPPIRLLPSKKAFAKKLAKQKGTEQWVGFVGRLSREKGIEHLITAVSLLKKDTVRLVFAGPTGKDVAGEAAYYTKVQKLLSRYQIPYTFLGILKDDELGAFYESLNVLALPSTNTTEAFGMVQAEAMLKGTPSITHTLPGVTVPISLTGMGISTNVTNHKVFAKALSTILSDKKVYASTAQVKKAQKTFSARRSLRRLESLILGIR